jgi:hypothetical protein
MMKKLGKNNNKKMMEKFCVNLIRRMKGRGPHLKTFLTIG